MKHLITIIAFAGLFSCQQTKKEYSTIAVTNEIDAIMQSDGKKLMEVQCYICHGPKGSENDGRIAPPMVAIKARYIDKEGLNKDEFIKYVTAFVENPTEELALMKGAVKKHGLMPKQVFPKGSVEKIASFMFDYQIAEPEWFKAHWESHGNENWTQSGKKYTEANAKKTYADIGLEYALETKKLLGTIEALEFCNIQAMPLTDSMAVHYNASIKRVSDKNRNPNNKANAEELKYIAKFKTQMAAKEEIKPVTIDKGNKIQFYYPIETNTMCLQCHGKEIKPEVAKQILKLYPRDLAIGYGENEVRGIWSITFDKKK
jgi:cytochrome c553